MFTAIVYLSIELIPDPQELPGEPFSMLITLLQLVQCTCAHTHTLSTLRDNHSASTGDHIPAGTGATIGGSCQGSGAALVPVVS